MKSLPPEIVEQIERAMADPMRLMPSEVEHLKQMGFGNAKQGMLGNGRSADNSSGIPRRSKSRHRDQS